MCQGNRHPGTAYVAYRTDLLPRLKQVDLIAVMQYPMLGSLEFLHELLEIMIVWDQQQVVNLG